MVNQYIQLNVWVQGRESEKERERNREIDRESERKRAVRGAEMRVQHTAWCVTMATAVSLPKITMHTHKYSNPVAEKKPNIQQSVAFLKYIAASLTKMHDFAGGHPYLQAPRFGNQESSIAFAARVPCSRFETEKKGGGGGFSKVNVM